MKYDLSNLIDIEKNQKFLDSFCVGMGIASAIIDLKGNVLIGSRWQRICTDFHRVNERTCEQCIESDTQLANELKKGKRFSIYQCRNGLTDAASPIIIEGEHIANTFVGQFLLHEPDQEFFCRQAAVYGFEQKDYLDALLSVPIVKKGSLPAILKFLTNFAEMVAEMGLDRLNQMRTEMALRESEAKYKSLANNLNVGIYRNTVGEKGEFVEANPTIVEMFGFGSREKFLKANVSDLYNNPYERKEYNAKILKDGAVRNEEIELQKKDGTLFIGSITAVAVKDENDNVKYYDGIIEDITERKQAEKALLDSEEKLVRSRKMESLGLLVGGVAHDLNNVLSGIVSYPELLLMDLPEESKLRKPIETMQASGHRAAAIVQDLLTVARGVATTKESLSLNDLIGDYLNSPEFKKLEQFHPTVTVKTQLATDLLNIVGSYVHIRKVVMNLVSNASEAIEGVGNVTISTMNCYIDRPLKGYGGVGVGEYAVLTVSDDGSGISSADFERIFEPFYTKKMMGRSGTGLGLAVVWNILQDHNGYIDVLTGKDGTSFEFYFPITRDEILDKDLSMPIQNYKGNGETILVVDDEKSQREISCKMLDKLNYKTRSVAGGEEAIEYLKEKSIDLLLMDMIMHPGINGREAYERILEICPSQKAIIVSGFAETDDVKDAQKLGAGQYIKKPYTLEIIGLAVKKELEK